MRYLALTLNDRAQMLKAIGVSNVRYHLHCHVHDDVSSCVALLLRSGQQRLRLILPTTKRTSHCAIFCVARTVVAICDSADFNISPAGIDKNGGCHPDWETSYRLGFSIRNAVS